MAEKINIKNFDRNGFLSWMKEHGENESRGNRVFQALWQRGTVNFFDIPMLSKQSMKKLDDVFYIPFLELYRRDISDDGTCKYLWKLSSGGIIESVLIPDENREEGLSDRLTLCVSSQWGCAMKCSFCLTGDLGLKGHLNVSEIANQVLQVSQDLPKGKRITNIVMMGMGEPLHNYKNLVTALRIMLDDLGLHLSHRKITVSTVGLVPAIRKLANELPVNLAISLNATTEEQRKQVMPITQKYSLEELLQVCREIPLYNKRITFEYVLMEGFNDSLEDAERLIELLEGIPSKINLIPYNENPNREILRPSIAKVKEFQDYLRVRGWNCTIRTTRGIDISAACGQLGKGAKQQEIRISKIPTASAIAPEVLQDM